MKKSDRNLFDRFLSVISPFRGGEDDFYQDQSEITLGSTNPSANFILLCIVLFFIIMGYWIATSEIDEVARGEATVVAASGTKEIETLEGSVVKKIYVKEGDEVKPGDILVQLDDTKYRASYGEKTVEKSMLEATIQRLEAELQGKQLDYSKEFRGANPLVVKHQEALYNSRIKNLTLETDMVKDRIIEKEKEIDSLKSALNFKKKNLRIIADRVDQIMPMVKKGHYPKVKLLKIQMSLNDEKAKVSEVEGKISENETALGRMKKKLEDVANDFKQEIHEEISTAQARLEELGYITKYPKDLLEQMTLRSPIKGIVKNMTIDAPGQIVRSGELVMEIVPSEDFLVIEAKLLPKDIGFIKVGQRANVKISAYDYLTFGMLEGVVTHISAEAFKGDFREPDYFKVKVRTARNFIGENPKNKITPGMTGSVDIITYKKSILDYLLKPLYRAKEGALRER